jgi:hypothetical protein
MFAVFSQEGSLLIAGGRDDAMATARQLDRRGAADAARAAGN